MKKILLITIGSILFNSISFAGVKPLDERGYGAASVDKVFKFEHPGGVLTSEGRGGNPENFDVLQVAVLRDGALRNKFRTFVFSRAENEGEANPYVPKVFDFDTAVKKVTSVSRNYVEVPQEKAGNYLVIQGVIEVDGKDKSFMGQVRYTDGKNNYLDQVTVTKPLIQ